MNWNPKSQNLRELAAELNLGLDSFVFLDDNPAEIGEVTANAPGVLALTLPENATSSPTSSHTSGRSTRSRPRRRMRPRRVLPPGIRTPRPPRRRTELRRLPAWPGSPDRHRRDDGRGPSPRRPTHEADESIQRQSPATFRRRTFRQDRGGRDLSLGPRERSLRRLRARRGNVTGSGLR